MSELFPVGERMPLPKQTCTPAPIGSGPTGETCGGCYFYHRQTYHNGAHLKCLKAMAAWTHGPGSDIKAKWRACREWQPKPTHLLFVGGPVEGKMTKSNKDRLRLFCGKTEGIYYLRRFGDAMVYWSNTEAVEWTSLIVAIELHSLNDSTWSTWSKSTPEQLRVFADYLEDCGDNRCEEARSLAILIEHLPPEVRA